MSGSKQCARRLRSSANCSEESLSRPAHSSSNVGGSWTHKAGCEWAVKI